ncbi:hypothetical protein [Dokdonia sp.]|uniref:hypothetical protein n=1 Tax=Dokdonia sp. TaxID=2024995 RepID=UPI00326672C3
MNFIKRVFYPKKNGGKIDLEWNEHLEKVYASIQEDELKYPIIMFSDIVWDFRTYQEPIVLIGESISGHWGLNEDLANTTDESTIVIDSSGKSYTLSHQHYDKETKTGFSYPSNVVEHETLENMKKRIIDGCHDYTALFCERNILVEKIETVKKIDSFRELILFADNELNF